MKVMVLTNGEFETREITNELRDLQEIVGGYIEIPYLSEVFSENEIDIIINEEGKFIDSLKPEIAVVETNSGDILDIIFGNCIFASHNQEGETTELNKEQVRIIKNKLAVSGLISLKNRGVFRVKVLYV